MHVKFMFFRVINPLFLTPPGVRRIVNLSTTCPLENLTYPWRVNSVSWKLCKCTSNERFWVINSLFLTTPGYIRIVNIYTTCLWESLMYLWSFNSVSWKLCECTSNLKGLITQKTLIRRAFAQFSRYRVETSQVHQRLPETGRVKVDDSNVPQSGQE